MLLFLCRQQTVNPRQPFPCLTVQECTRDTCSEPGTRSPAQASNPAIDVVTITGWPGHV